MGLLDALLLRRQMRDGARGCDSRFVWAVMKASFRAGTVGAGAAMAGSASGYAGAWNCCVQMVLYPC
jgi:hypothetical protein